MPACLLFVAVLVNLILPALQNALNSPSTHARACCFSNEMGRGEFARRLIKIVCQAGGRAGIQMEIGYRVFTSLNSAAPPMLLNKVRRPNGLSGAGLK